MKHKTLGTSDINVSAICLGTMMFGGQTEEVDARKIIDHAADQGVNFIDTANIYNEGQSEEIVGRAIAKQRGDWILATKVGMAKGHNVTGGGLSRNHILQSIDQSLSRLGTDYVDIYYCHRTDSQTPWEETISVLAELIDSGKIRTYGVSNIRAWQIAHVVHIASDLGVPPPVVCQPYYNLLNRMPEVELLPACKHFALGVVPYSPIARGILTGKYLNKDIPPESRVGRKDNRVMTTEWRDESLEIAQKIKTYAEAKGTMPVHFASAWVLNNSAVTSFIAGPRTFDQWTSYLGALEYSWSSEDEAFVDQLVPPGHPSTPGYTDPKYPIEGRFPTQSNQRSDS